MQLTAEERKEGSLSGERIAIALRTIRDSGLLLLEDLHDPAQIGELRAAYDAQLARHIAAKGGLEAINQRAFGHSHIGMVVPMVEPFASPQIVAHPIVVQLLDRLLGDDFCCTFYHSNTAYPGSGYQPTHRDNPPLFGSELSVAHPAAAIVLNVPLCDFTEQNGSTEVWPGSHLIVDVDPADAQALEERAAELASVRTNMRVGSVVLRDLRTWHRGTPNRAEYLRSMLAIVYRRGWLYQPAEDSIPQATWQAWPARVRQIFRHCPLTSAEC
jgi:hypothetical protein